MTTSHLQPAYERLLRKYETAIALLKKLQHKKYFTDLDRRAINDVVAEAGKA